MAMKRILMLFAPVIACAISAAANAGAYDWTVNKAQVTQIEPSYMPTRVLFMISSNGGSSCPAGTWLTYSGSGSDAAAQQSNVKYMYATLLAALAAGRPVDVFSLGYAANTCAVNYVHILNQ